jgi:hypothetical protein
MARHACLAIGVSMVTPPNNEAMRFGYLDGAVIAARAIGEWALRSGFGDDNVRVVHDGEKPVTRERVQQAVDELFPKRAEIVEQLILAFCGHGLTDANFGSISWLFSDSQRSKYRVVADRFYAELLLEGVQRITLITDACREAPKDLDLMRFDAVRGIAVEGGTPVESPKFDLFAACQDGQLGYMVSVPNSAQPGKCVFSGVIADVLWGIEPAAINNGVITTATFGACVRSRTAQRAKDYRLNLNPQCLVDPEAAVLYDAAKPPQGPPGLQPWPPAGTAAVMGTAVPAAAAASAAALNLALVHSDAGFRKRILGRRFGLDRHDLAVSSESIRIPDESKDRLQDLVTLRTSPSPAEPRARIRGKRRKIQALVDRLESDAVADVRKRAAGAVRRSVVQIRPSPGPDGSNLIVSGNEARIWSRSQVKRRERTSARMGFRVNSDAQGTPILVELADGSFTPVVPYEGLYAVVNQGATGDVLQAYGQVYGEQHRSREAFKGALEAIADFAAGRIRAERVDELAGRLRYDKHNDPVLGAICAYLYRATADFDSIRRMAYFYALYGQPVPFDIALLGAMKVTREAKGALRLRVPAVEARKSRDRGPNLPKFVTQATPAQQGWIGGRCPWLGLGWDYVGLPRPEWAVLVDGLADHAGEVRRSGFTVLPKKVGMALAKSWGLKRRCSGQGSAETATPER